jgi:Peptidase S24-like
MWFDREAAVSVVPGERINISRRHLVASVAALPARDERDPSKFKSTYALIGDGDCMSPIIENGTCIGVDPKVRAKAGDIVVVWPASGTRPSIKRLTHNIPFFVKGFPYLLPKGSEVSPVLLMESINPNQHFSIECCKVKALHVAIGTFAKAGKVGGMHREADLTPFSGREAVQS